MRGGLGRSERRGEETRGVGGVGGGPSGCRGEHCLRRARMKEAVCVSHLFLPLVNKGF